jgi:hypothetical protein
MQGPPVTPAALFHAIRSSDENLADENVADEIVDHFDDP